MLEIMTLGLAYIQSGTLIWLPSTYKGLLHNVEFDTNVTLMVMIIENKFKFDVSIMLQSVVIEGFIPGFIPGSAEPGQRPDTA